MSALILSLPRPAASAQTLYAFTQGVAGSGVREALASLLPRTGRNDEVVALVPASALSWHSVTLPAGKALSGAALRTLLVGLLEERLLDDVQQLHLALQPGWQPGQTVWVAVCDKTWLKSHLQALESAQVTVNRIVPALWPTAPDAAPQLLATGTPQAVWLWISAAQGVWGLPLPSGLASVNPDLLSRAQLSAEPAVAESAEQPLQRPPRLLQPAQAWVNAAQSDWDLAQLDLAATGAARWLKTLQRVQQTLWHAPAWRPARWGLAVLLLSQVLGLNAWAWKLKADLQQRQTGMAQVMTQTFPEIQVVVDAPLQMRREVDRLRQATGQTAPNGLEPLLAALGPALPEGVALNQIDFQEGQLRLPDLNLSEAQASSLQSRLQAQNYQAQREGSVWLIRMASPRGTP